MSVSLVNRLEPVLGVPVPMAKLLKGPSVEELVDSIFPGLANMSPQEVEVSQRLHRRAGQRQVAQRHRPVVRLACRYQAELGRNGQIVLFPVRGGWIGGLQAVEQQDWHNN